MSFLTDLWALVPPLPWVALPPFWHSVIQTSIVLLSLVSAFCCASTSVRRRIVGCLTGLIAQPLWLLSSISSTAWGIAVLSFWFAFCHWRNLRANVAQLQFWKRGQSWKNDLQY